MGGGGGILSQVIAALMWHNVHVTSSILVDCS